MANIINEKTEKSCLNILLVEDNEGDVELIKTAMGKMSVTNNLSVVEDGENAIRFLLKKDEYANAPFPDLILLDLNLPNKSGLEVLTEIKNDKDLKQVPVIILTSSNYNKDVQKAYDSHVSAYIVKPDSLEKLIDLTKRIEEIYSDKNIKLPPP